jgi:hypothetical protein
MGLAVREVPHERNGVAAALAYLQESGNPASTAQRRAA